MFRYFFEPS